MKNRKKKPPQRRLLNTKNKDKKTGPIAAGKAVHHSGFV
jgi:hypothetical protein